MATEMTVHQEKEFSNIDYAEKSLREREFRQCKFVGCSFANSDLRGNIFEDCVFENCNFSMANIDNASFQEVVFKGCKILGIDFTKCKKMLFSAQFEQSVMDYCNFFDCRLKNTKFIGCSLKEVDFSEADLTAAVFQKSNLERAIFSNTNLGKTNFRGAFNISIDPEFNKMKGAKLTIYQLEGLLQKYRLDIEGGE